MCRCGGKWVHRGWVKWLHWGWGNWAPGTGEVDAPVRREVVTPGTREVVLGGSNERRKWARAEEVSIRPRAEAISGGSNAGGAHT